MGKLLKIYLKLFESELDLKIRSIFLAESIALTALQCRTEPNINTIKTTKTTPLAFYSRPNLLSNNYAGANKEINYFIIEFIIIYNYLKMNQTEEYYSGEDNQKQLPHSVVITKSHTGISSL